MVTFFDKRLEKTPPRLILVSYTVISQLCIGDECLNFFPSPGWCEHVFPTEHLRVQGIEAYSTYPYARTEFFCDAGYILIGNTSIQCLPGGSWSNPVPTCISGKQEAVVFEGSILLRGPQSMGMLATDQLFGREVNTVLIPGPPSLSVSTRILPED